MKRLLLLLFALILWTGLSWGQTITIGTGTLTTRYPLNDYYSHSRSQSLYLSSEIGTSGSITNLRWYRNDVGANANAIGTTEIWLMETTNSVLTGTAWEGPGTLVATISNIDLGPGGDWLNIPITSFAYSGGANNLLVSVRTQNAPYTTPHALYRYTTTSTNYRLRQGNSDGTNPPAMSLSYLRPNIQLVFPEACPGPTALLASNITATSATISWTAPASAPTSGYQWEVRSTGAGGSGATGLAASGSTAAGVTTANVTTGLTANTPYNLYVRSNCGGGGFSSWAGPKAFATACVAITSLPWTEGFEGVTIPAFPSCWTKENGDWVTTNNANTTSDADARTGTQFLRNAWSAVDEYMWTPGFQLTAGISYDFTFWWAGDNSSGWTGDVFYNSSAVSAGATQLGGSFVTSGTITTKTYAKVASTFVPVSSGAYYFAIRVNATFDPNYLSFDDFSFGLSPTCFEPTALLVTNIAPTSATISWTAPTPLPGSGYEWEVRTIAGDVVKSGSTGAGVLTASVTGLTANTPYNLYVRSKCGATEYSSWGGPKAFATPCAPIAVFPWTEGFEGVTIPAFPSCWTKENGDWVTTNNANSTYDADARTGTQFLRESYSATNEFMWSPGFQLTAGTSYDFSFWWAGDTYSGWTGDVFYNRSPTSTDATQIGGSFVTSGTTTAKTYAKVASTFVPTISGTYYFAIRVNATSSPWYLSFDDFSFGLTPPPCAPPSAQPTALVLTSTTTSVSGSFTASATATGYLVVRSTSATLGATPANLTTYSAGQTLGSGTVVSSGANLTFEGLGLTGGTNYYFFVFAYSTGETCSGPIYRTASPLSGSISTKPLAPATLVATATGSTQISFTATPNANGNNIIVAWNTTNTFGNPTGSLVSGAPITGGGTVHYVGSAAGLYAHSGLQAGQTYYYRAWSIVSGPAYSSTFVNANATTFVAVPFATGFDQATLGDYTPAGWTRYSSPALRPWTVTNNASLGNYSPPYAEAVYYSETAAKNEWLVSPPIQMNAGQTYLIKFFVKAPGWAPDPEKLKLHVANSPALAAISTGTKLWDGNNLQVPTFTEMTANFTPTTSGGYYFGWHAYSIANVDFIAMDDVKIEELPMFQITPESYDFRQVNVGLQSIPQSFTFKNNRPTSVTVNSVSLTGANAGSFVLQDGNTYPKTLASGATMTVNARFKPTATGINNASIKIVQGANTYNVAVSGTGYLNGPQNLTASAVPETSVQLQWTAPLENEIRFDDNTVESWYWVGDPSATTQLFSTKITIPQNGTLTHISVLSRADAASTWQSIRLVPESSNAPNLGAPVQVYNNIPVTSATGEWILLPLTTPLAVTAGQNYYIITQWPAASSVGPFVGTDDGYSFGRCAYTTNSGTAWTPISNNFMMRAYMGTGDGKSSSLVLKSGDEVPELKYLPTLKASDRVSFNEKRAIEGGVSVTPPAIIATEGGSSKAPLSYTVRRGETTGVYTETFTGITGTSYLDNTTQGAKIYYYTVSAVYPNGEGVSNEATVATLCTTLPIPYSQNFDGVPPCWTQSYDGTLTAYKWGISTTNLAGGTPNEMKAGWQSGNGILRLISPALNTTGETQLTLGFKHMFDDFGPGITYKIQTSSDGITWTDEAWVNQSVSNTNVGPENVYVNLINNIGGTTYIAWVLDGNHYQFDNWYIDNVSVTAAMIVTPVSQNLTCYGSNDGSISLMIEGGVPPFVFNWTGPNDFSSSLQDITNLAAGTYNYSVTDSQGTSNDGTVTLTQPTMIPVPTVTSLTVTYDGLLHSLVPVVPQTPAVTILIWYNAATGGEIIPAPSAVNAGVYPAWVSALDEVTGCESDRIALVLTINKKQLTVKADNQSKCQVVPIPELTFTYTGFVANEGPGDLVTAPVASTTATAASLPGTYPITLAGGVSNNYSFNYVAGVLTVVKTPIVSAGPDGAVCVSESFPIVGATASNYTSIAWSTSGNGTFSSTSAINPVYNPGSADINNGSVVLTLTGDPASSCSVQDQMTLTLQNDLPVSVTVVQVTEDVCVGTIVEFTALPVNGGLTPAYQWKVNGTNAGTNSPDFSYIPTNNDQVSVVMTSSIGCALNNPAISEPVVVSVTADLVAGVSIFADATTVCDFTPVTFTALAENGGSNPTYQWYVNGVAAGTNMSTYTYAPLDEDEVYVVMTSSHACAVVPVATSNIVAISVSPPYLELIANPINGGTVVGAGNYPTGTEVTVVANPTGGWEFLNWKNADGMVLSTEATYTHTINYCYEALTATFSSTAKVAGQLKYFNSNETVIPSPNSNSVFFVQLFEGETAIGERQLVKYNLDNGLDSYFEYIGVESGKDYKLRVWEQATVNQLSNVWTWNHWGGVTAIDALIISFMNANNPTINSLPWIAPVAVPNYTPYFTKVADINNSGSLTALDALVLQYRMIGTAGFMPLPGGAHNFALATTKLASHALKSYPAAPQLLFTPIGNYQGTTAASDVYYEVALNNLSDGLNVYNVYFVATGDLNASYVPTSGAKSSTVLNYNGLLAGVRGEEVTIPIILDQSANIAAMSLGLSYNTSALEILDVIDYPIHQIDAKEGTVRIAWIDQDGESYTAGQILLNVKARIIGDITSGSRYFELLSNTEFADVTATEISGLTLTTPYIETGVTSLIDLNNLVLSHSSFPNPFKDETRINFTLPESGKVSVIVYNHFGQEVKVLTQEVKATGAHHVTLTNSDLRDAGTYFYRITLEGLNKTYSVRGTVVFVK